MACLCGHDEDCHKVEDARGCAVCVCPALKVSLYADMVAAGVSVDSHESDLYVQSTPAARSILARYPLQAKNATYFQHEGNGQTWIDIPFSFEPWWAARQTAEEKCSCQLPHYRDGRRIPA